MYAEKSGVCHDVVSPNDTAACNHTSHSLCEKTCAGGQGRNSIDIFLGPESGPEPGPSHV